MGAKILAASENQHWFAKTNAKARCPEHSIFKKIPVTMAEGPHPFPFRTRPLSPPALMILLTSGKVGCRRVKLKAALNFQRGFFCCLQAAS